METVCVISLFFVYFQVLCIGPIYSRKQVFWDLQDRCGLCADIILLSLFFHYMLLYVPFHFSQIWTKRMCIMFHEISSHISSWHSWCWVWRTIWEFQFIFLKENNSPYDCFEADSKFNFYCHCQDEVSLWQSICICPKATGNVHKVHIIMFSK